MLSSSASSGLHGSAKSDDGRVTPLRPLTGDTTAGSWDALLALWRSPKTTPMPSSKLSSQKEIAQMVDGSCVSTGTSSKTDRGTLSVSDTNLLTLIKDENEYFTRKAIRGFERHGLSLPTFQTTKQDSNCRNVGDLNYNSRTTQVSSSPPSLRHVVPATPGGWLPVEATSRAAVCRHNSVRATECGRKFVARLWELLAVSFDLMAQPVPRGGEGSAAWKYSTLGLPMIKLIIHTMRRRGDLCSLAMALCVLGGSEVFGEMWHMTSRSDSRLSDKYTLRENRLSLSAIVGEFDLILLSYEELLRKWHLFVEATEVWEYNMLKEQT